MVQAGAIAAIIFNITICFGLPLGVFIWLLARYGRGMVKPMLVGMLVFLIMQIAIRIPLVTVVLPHTPAFTRLMEYPVSYGLFLGFTAGLAEEVGRWLGYKIFLRNRTNWATGVSLGVGHAGMEAALLVGLANINNLVHAMRINSGVFWHWAAANTNGHLAERIFTYLTHLNPLVTAMAGLERILIFIVQIAFSLMVLYAVKTKNALWLVLAIFAHTFVDAPVVILPKVMLFNIYMAELFFVVCALISFWYIMRARKMFAK